MKYTTFLIFGYGVPEDILKGENYNRYLNLAFNRIFDIVREQKIEKPLIIFSGGRTDCFPPFHRTEAGEMMKFFLSIASRPFVAESTKNWRYVPEENALSTLENFLYSKEILEKENISEGKIYIFCEHTREKKVTTLAQNFLKEYSFIVISVDFDNSSSRYLDPEFIEKKEGKDMEIYWWAMKNHENFKKFRDILEEKLERLRKVTPEKRTEAINEWWKEKMKEIEEGKIGK